MRGTPTVRSDFYVHSVLSSPLKSPSIYPTVRSFYGLEQQGSSNHSLPGVTGSGIRRDSANFH